MQRASTRAAAFGPQVNERVSASWRRYCKAPALLQRIAALPMTVHYVLADAGIRPLPDARGAFARDPS